MNQGSLQATSAGNPFYYKTEDVTMSFNKPKSHDGFIIPGAFFPGKILSDPSFHVHRPGEESMSRIEAPCLKQQERPSFSGQADKEAEAFRHDGRCGFATGTDE